MAAQLASEVLNDLTQTLAKIRMGLSRTDRQGRAKPETGAEMLDETASALEAQIVQILEAGIVGPIRALDCVMTSHSRRALRILPAASDPIELTSIAWERFLRWAQADDLRVAKTLGLTLGPRLDQVFRIGQTDAEFRAAALGLLENGPAMNDMFSIWRETRTALWAGEPEDVAELLDLHIKMYPDAMSDALHDLVAMNDALGAEILFVAGARPRAGEPLVPEDTSCLPGGFIDRARSSHGQVAALQGPGPLELIKTYRDKVPMF